MLAGLGVLTFSFSVPMTKVAVRGLDPLLAATGRGVVAGVLAIIVLLATRSARPSNAQIGPLLAVVAGVVFGFPVLTSYALHHAPSTHGAVVAGLLPLATAGMAVVRAGERPSARYWACSLVGSSAVVAYVVSHGGASVGRADTLLVLAVLAAAVAYTEGAVLARAMTGWQVICWALVLALPLTVTLAAFAASRHHPHATAGQWAAFGYISVFSMFLGFFAWYGGLARAGIARGGQLQLAQPALALVWGWPIVGERLNGAAMAAVVVVLLAVAAGRRTTVKSAPASVTTAASASVSA